MGSSPTAVTMSGECDGRHDSLRNCKKFGFDSPTGYLCSVSVMDGTTVYEAVRSLGSIPLPSTYALLVFNG